MAERRNPIPTPRQMVIRLSDGLSRELGGINEDNAVEALRYAIQRLEEERSLAETVLRQHDRDTNSVL